MTTLAEAVDGVYRDLADEGKKTFSQLQVEDFVRGGIADLNRVSPVDSMYVIPLESDVDTGLVTKFDYDTPIELPYRVEVFRIEDGYSYSITEPVDGWVGSGGFNFRQTASGGVIDFPLWWLQTFPVATHQLRMHGYAARPLPYQVDPDPSPELPLSPEEVYSVRTYARSAGFDLLAHDRSLFAQWQGQTNNTDVSPTQMMQMSANAKTDWDRHRSNIRVVRKYW
jgi:hypothetical protein